MDNQIEIHDINCRCDNTPEYNKEFFSYEYDFLYELKLVTVKVCACMKNYDGTPHLKIIDGAIRILRKEQGINCPPNYEYIPHAIRGRLQDYFEIGTILEIVKGGGFSYNYFVEHDENSDFVKNNKEKLIIVGEYNTYNYF